MNRSLAFILGAAVLLVQPCVAQHYADIPSKIDFPADAGELEAMRASGRLIDQRAHVWQIFAGITQPTAEKNVPIFLTWFGAGEAFADSSTPPPERVRGLLQSFSLPVRQATTSAHAGTSPLIIRAHYNWAAFTHVRANGLQSASHLMAIANAQGAADINRENNSIPAFPRDSVVIKTVWWPVPAEGIVPLPVWDPASNPPRAGGNDYVTWSRVVAVSARPGFGAPGATVDLEFAGRAFTHVRALGVDDLYHFTLDERMAGMLMRDAEARTAARLVLGRQLRAGDMLALVALHLATRELTNWVWGTFWWHDRPDEGPHAAPHRGDTSPPWTHYLMSVSFDTDIPRESDGSPHVAFNPWLEGRFPDSGQGGGLTSNCMACHQRASTALDKPFMVTRGLAQPRSSLPAKLEARTSFLWSVPMQAR
jgi:hypothetical protein